MKLLLLTTMILMTTTVFGSEIAKYRFGFQDEGNYVNVEINVLEGQEAEIRLTKLEVLNPFNYNVIETRNETVTIPKKLYESIFSDITSLSSAKITTIERVNVCLLLIAFPGTNESLQVKTNYNQGSNQFNGELKEVLNLDVCWSFRHTSPEKSHMKKIAYELQAKLQTITLMNL